ncbi:MAG: discoidin domain-containing protein [Oscillospiraceae bacterium]|nr:discoidin domain-containing protein [Oscillospiraceae bacterium]
MKPIIFRLMVLLVTTVLLFTAVPLLGAAQTAAEDEWDEVKALVGQYIGEWRNTNYTGLFKDQIPETAVLGNGDVGVASGGNGTEKTFHISKGDFWVYGNNTPPIPVGGVTIKPADEPADTWPDSLALNKTVTESSNNGADRVGQRAVNGQWAPDSGYVGWSSGIIGTGAGRDPQPWMRIDFGAAMTFDRIIIRHDPAARPEQLHTATKAFNIVVSDDGNSWGDPIYSISDNTAATSDILLAAPVTARYIRLNVIQGTQATDADSRDNPRARIGQFEVYNTAAQTFPTAPVTPAITDFYEEQDILDACIRTKFKWGGKNVRMYTYLAAEGNNLLITRLTNDADAALELRAEAWGKTGSSSRPVTASSTATTATATRATMSGNLNTNDTNAYKSVAALTTQLVGAVPTDNGSSASAAWLDFTLPAGGTVYIVTAVGGGGRTYDNRNNLIAPLPADQTAGLLAAADSAAKLDGIKAEHAAWWKDFWLRSYISLDTADANLAAIQKYYYAAQYMLGCNCSEDRVPPGLYGLWHTTDSPAWNSDYHLNYNYIATFYGIYSSGRAEFARAAMQPLFDYEETATKAAATTSELKKISVSHVEKKIAEGKIHPTDGIADALLFPVGIGPFGMRMDPSYHNQLLNAVLPA